MRNLQAEMKRYGISLLEVQSILGCSEKTARNKVNGDTEFSISEAIKLKRAKFPSMEFEYLYACDTNDYSH